MPPRRIPFQVLEGCILETLERRGVAPEDGKVTARVLLESEARGYPAQGVRRVAEMCSFLDRGNLSPKIAFERLEPAPALRVFRSEASLGHPIAVQAADAAADLARSCGIGCVAVLGAGHIGYLTHYAERAAASGASGASGVFCFVTTTSSPAVSWPGAGVPLLGTNAMAYAFPLEDGILCADFATAEVARGEVLERLQAGTRFDRDVGTGPDGHPSRDPAEILRGGILPMGGHRKGALVSLLLSTLAGPLVGGVPNHEVLGTRWPDARPNKTDFFLALDIAAFGDPETFQIRMRGFLDALTGSTPDFHVPGQHSRARWEEALRNGFEETADLRDLLAMASA
jgi:LDH2 family malate/lactate/ureidoglycolate dehydrogenase